MSRATRAKLSASLRRAAARRKALHLKRHLKPATIAKLRARLAKYRHMHRKRKAMTPAQRSAISARLRGRRHLFHQRATHRRGSLFVRIRHATTPVRYHVRRPVTRFRITRRYSAPRHRFRLVSLTQQRFRVKKVRTG